MIKTVVLKDLKLKNGIAIAGFPGMALVGKTVAEFLVRVWNAEPIIRIYATDLPAHLYIKDSIGLGDLSSVTIYYAKKAPLPLVIVTSDDQPRRDEGQNELSHTIVEYLQKIGIEELIATAAFVSEETSELRKVYVVGNNEKVMEKYIKAGAIRLKTGLITGMNGVIIGWAKLYDIDAVCVLGETWSSIIEFQLVDYNASKAILDLLNKVWNLGIDTSKLQEYGAEVENEVKRLISTIKQMYTEKPKTGGKEYTYIT